MAARTSGVHADDKQKNGVRVRCQHRLKLSLNQYITFSSSLVFGHQARITLNYNLYLNCSVITVTAVAADTARHIGRPDRRIYTGTMYLTTPAILRPTGGILPLMTDYSSINNKQ